MEIKSKLSALMMASALACVGQTARALKATAQLQSAEQASADASLSHSPEAASEQALQAVTITGDLPGGTYVVASDGSGAVRLVPAREASLKRQKPLIVDVPKNAGKTHEPELDNWLLYAGGGVLGALQGGLTGGVAGAVVGGLVGVATTAHYSRKMYGAAFGAAAGAIAGGAIAGPLGGVVGALLGGVLGHFVEKAVRHFTKD